MLATTLERDIVDILRTESTARRIVEQIALALSDCSGCFRLERLPGGACTHWKAPPCHGARK
jgi:hypothetical protein